jgi:TonB family protein
MPVPRLRWQFAGLMAVMVGHLLLVRSFPPLSPPFNPESARAIEVSIVSMPQAVHSMPEPVLMKPGDDVVPAPEIALEEAQSAATLTALSRVDMSQVIPPRPDPSHPNAAPRLPVGLVVHSPASALVAVFVDVGGAITDARVATSTGNSTLDSLALEYVEAQWRFLPASLSGRPIGEWTTVRVSFKA